VIVEKQMQNLTVAAQPVQQQAQPQVIPQQQQVPQAGFTGGIPPFGAAFPGFPAGVPQLTPEQQQYFMQQMMLQQQMFMQQQFLYQQQLAAA